MTLPPNYRLMFSPEVIASRIGEMGTEINRWANETSSTTGRDVLAIPVLRGGMFFFSDLMRLVTTSVEVAPARVKAYDQNTNIERASLSLSFDGVRVKDRHIILIDDICDSGRTHKILTDHLYGEGAVEVKCAVLVRRKLEISVFDPDWIGFEFSGPDWFVGYGMDDGNRWSNLPGVYIIKES